MSQLPIEDMTTILIMWGEPEKTNSFETLASADPTVESFWNNAKDSLEHALQHLFELDMGARNHWHHHKWLILSVHHAALCIAYVWLKTVDPKDRVFQPKNDKKGELTFSYPALSVSLKALNKLSEQKKVSGAEVSLIAILEKVDSVRNQLFHRRAPDKIDNESVSYAAMSMLAMLRLMAHWRKTDFYGLLGESPEHRKVISQAIHGKRFDEYQKLIEALLHEQLPRHQLEQCPTCGANAVISKHCEACFKDATEISCPQCESNFLIAEEDQFPQSCPDCGHEIA